jgi:hypothetical protein
MTVNPARRIAPHSRLTGISHVRGRLPNRFFHKRIVARGRWIDALDLSLPGLIRQSMMNFQMHCGLHGLPGLVRATARPLAGRDGPVMTLDGVADMRSPSRDRFFSAEASSSPPS